MSGPATKNKPSSEKIDRQDEELVRKAGREGRIRHVELDPAQANEMLTRALHHNTIDQFNLEDKGIVWTSPPVDLGWQTGPGPDPTSYHLSLGQSSKQVTLTQPASPPPDAYPRMWEAGATSRQNRELFVQQVSNEGVQKFGQLMQTENPGRMDETTARALESSVQDKLGQWISQHLPDSNAPLDPSSLSLKAILRQGRQILAGELHNINLQFGGASSAELKAELLSAIDRDIDRQVLVAFTDGSWGSLGPKNLYPQQGNERLGLDLAVNDAPNWGLNYANANFDPWKAPDGSWTLPKEVLQSRLDWLMNKIGDLVEPKNFAELQEQTRHLLQVAGNKQLNGDDLLPADPVKKMQLARQTQDRLQQIKNHLDADETSGRKELLLYLVSISKAHKTAMDALPAADASGVVRLPALNAELLTHDALGLFRQIVIGSDQPQTMTMTYLMEQENSTLAPNSFNPKKLDIHSVMLIQGGPDPSDRLELARFQRCQMKFMQETHPGAQVQWIDYNAQKKGYEISFTDQNLPADPAYFDGRPMLAFHYLNNIYHPDFGSGELSAIVGQSEPALSSIRPRLNAQVIPFENKMIVPSLDVEESSWRIYSHIGLSGRPSAPYQGPTFNPSQWPVWSDQQHRVENSQLALYDLASLFGGSAFRRDPLLSTYIGQVMPGGTVARGYFNKQDNLWAGALSYNGVEQGSYASLGGTLGHFISPLLDPANALYDPTAVKYLGNFGLNEFAIYSPGLYSAWANSVQAAYFYTAKDKDSANAAKYIEAAQHHTMAAVKGALYEFYPGDALYPALVAASNYFGKDTFEALELTSQINALYSHNLLGAHGQLNMYLQYSPDWQASFKRSTQTNDRRSVYTDLDAPLTIPVLGTAMESAYSNAMMLAVREQLKFMLGGGLSSELYFGAGDIFSMGGGVRQTMGTYQQGTYAFGTQDVNFGNRPIWDLRGVLRAEKKTDRSSFYGEITIQPSPRDYWALANPLFGLDKKGIFYSDLYTPSPPVNFNALMTPTDVVADLKSRGINITPAQSAALAALKPGQSAPLTGIGQSMLVKSENGSYNIYPLVDMSNPAWANWAPLTSFEWGAMTTLPIRSIMDIGVAVGQEWNVNAISLSKAKAEVTVQFKDPTMPAFRAGFVRESLSQPINTYSLGASWQPFSTDATDQFGNILNSLKIDALGKETFFPKGGYAVAASLRVSFVFDIFNSQINTTNTEYTQKGQVLISENPDNSYSYTRQNGPWKKQ